MQPQTDYKPHQLSDLQNNQFDFWLATDGAGHADGFGGACAFFIQSSTGLTKTIRLAQTETSTDRMEFQALLIGMRSLFDLMDLTNGDKRHAAEFRKFTVLWTTDRQDLAYSVDTLRSGYARRANKDQWASLDYFEKYFQIIPVHIDRNTTGFQELCDRQASQLRVLIKHYVEEQPL